MLARLLIVTAFLGLAACGGRGELALDGTDIPDIPSLSNLDGGLRGDPDHPPYTENPLAQD